MPKISTLGQKLWPTGREQTHTHTQTHRQTDRQTEKANTEDPFFRFFFILDFLLKERSEKMEGKKKQRETKMKNG